LRDIELEIGWLNYQASLLCDESKRKLNASMTG
jgi:hypothetical protein